MIERRRLHTPADRRSEPPPPPVSPLLLRARDAAAALSISPRALWERTNRGEIPVVRIGVAVRYDPSDLRAWIESHKGKKHSGTRSEGR